MATITYPIPSGSSIQLRMLGWMAGVGLLAALLAILTISVIENRYLAQDNALMDWVTGWDFPGLSALFGSVSLLTGAKAGLIYGPLGITFLLLLGKTREAIVFAVVGLTIAVIATLGDYTLGQLVGRGRPLAAAEEFAAFPSGHVFGSTVFFGFLAFLAVYFRVKRKLLLPMLVLMGLLVLLVGPARIYEGAHWPSDVAAGYLLGGIWLLIVIPAFIYLRNNKWIASLRQGASQIADNCDDCRTERSIASVVMLNPERGTATKVYRPPAFVRILYWLAFQAQFPYVNNRIALQAGDYRRKVANLLTLHRFGKRLVAPVLAVNETGRNYEFVTEYVPGEKVENDEAAREFLSQVSETFGEAGLPVWQVNPNNPHAQSNLIRTPEGDFKIIDLESALVTPFLPKGHRLSALKSGNFPVFDDIDFPRMRDYIATNVKALENSLGSYGLAELNHAVGHLEETIRLWKEAEPRLWGRIVRWSYRLLDWKAKIQSSTAALREAEQAAESFFDAGIDRWEKEGRISPSESAVLRSRLTSGEAQIATRHLGAHLVLSVAIALPVPGARSLARFLWTLTFWAKFQISRFRHRGTDSVGQACNIHTPLVMVLALVPGLGGVAYLAARPLRNKLLARLLLDQIALKLPFRLHARMRLGRILAPAPNKAVAT